MFGMHEIPDALRVGGEIGVHSCLVVLTLLTGFLAAGGSERGNGS